MKILRGEDLDLPIESIQPHPRNANNGDLGAIDESVEVNGFFGRILVQKSTRFILVGSHRWEIARRKGAEIIPSTVLDVDDETALRIMLADNRTARLGQDDGAALSVLLEELARGSGLEGTGYTGDDLDELLRDLEEKPPKAPKTPDPNDPIEVWKVALGQVWEVPSARAPGQAYVIPVVEGEMPPRDAAKLLQGLAEKGLKPRLVAPAGKAGPR